MIVLLALPIAAIALVVLAMGLRTRWRRGDEP